MAEMDKEFLDALGSASPNSPETRAFRISQEKIGKSTRSTKTSTLSNTGITQENFTIQGDNAGVDDQIGAEPGQRVDEGNLIQRAEALDVLTELIDAERHEGIGGDEGSEGGEEGDSN